MECLQCNKPATVTETYKNQDVRTCVEGHRTILASQELVKRSERIKRLLKHSTKLKVGNESVFELVTKTEKAA